MEVPHPVNALLQHCQATVGHMQRLGSQALKRPGQNGMRVMTRRPESHRIVRGRSAPLAAIIPGDTLVEQVFTTGMVNFLNLYNSALIVRLVLTWFPNPPEVIVGPLSTLCDPYLNLFRGIIPPLGGTLDFSPILAFVTLSFFTNTAVALPCELGPDGRTPLPPQRPRSQQHEGLWAPMSRFQRAWAQRLGAQRQQSQQQ